MKTGGKILGSLLAAFVMVASGIATAYAAPNDRCVSWSEARAAGLISQFKLLPAAKIKQRVEAKYSGKVVSFQICNNSGRLIYKLAVFRPDGNVQFVTEPAHR